jgi:hypothetical protein
LKLLFFLDRVKSISEYSMCIPANELSNLKPCFKPKFAINKKQYTYVNENEIFTDKPATESFCQKLSEMSMKPDFPSLSKLNDHIKELIQTNVFFLFNELLLKIGEDYKDKGLSHLELKNKYLSYFQNDLKNSNLFCELMSANLGTMDLNQLKQEIDSNKVQTIKSLDKTSVGDHGYLTADFSSDVSASTTDQPNENESDTNDADDASADATKCFARTANRKQCSRKKQKGQQFCGSHLHNQPHGRIDQASDPGKTKPKKRGRPPKNAKQTDPAKIEILQMDAVVETINNIDYLVDNVNGNIYKNPENIAEDATIEFEKLKLLGKKLPNNKITWYSDDDLKFIDKSI